MSKMSKRVKIFPFKNSVEAIAYAHSASPDEIARFIPAYYRMKKAFEGRVPRILKGDLRGTQWPINRATKINVLRDMLDAYVALNGPCHLIGLLPREFRIG